MDRFIHGFGVGLGIWGLVTLLLGNASLWPSKTVRGPRARIIGLVTMLPLLAASLLGYLWASVVAANGWQFSLDEIKAQGTGVEASLIAAALGIGYYLASRAPQPKQSDSLPEAQH